jgi:RND family efflux transporter MFP subunit
MRQKQMAALALSALLTLSLTACGGSEDNTEEDAAPAGVAVQVETVQADTIATENKVSGTVSADNESSVFIATTAKCTAVYAEAGDVVQAGDKLCTLDLGSSLSSQNAARISYNAAVQSYQDQKAILDKQVSMAEDNMNNTQALFEIGAASQLEVDQAELNYQNTVASRTSALSQLEASIQNAKSGVEQLDLALEDVDSNGNVIAPASGILVTMNAVENSYVSTSMPLAVIDGVDQMKVVTSVSEALVPSLSAGDEATVSVSAIDTEFTATIRSVERSASAQTKLYTVTLTVPADVSGLLDGMFADVTFHTNVSEGAVVVPSEAILTSGSTQYVFVVENDAAKYVEVTTGLTGSGVTEILSGLTPGQQLVTVGQAYLTDGDAVRIVTGEE